MQEASPRTFPAPAVLIDSQIREDQFFTEIRIACEEYLRISAELDTIVGPDRLKLRLVAFEKYRKTLADMKELLRQQEWASPQGANGTDHLTPRERQVLALIARGKKTKVVAFDLGIAFKTAACHRTRIMSKLYAQNAADLTRAAIRMGLIEP
jgi:DNA-binding NarL/FixJ family response regulator